MRNNTIISVVLLSGLIVFSTYPDQVQIKRKHFKIPLPMITLLFNSDNSFEEVFVTFGSSHEGWAVGPRDDRYTKDTRKERIDHIYQEHKSSYHTISQFEARVITEVTIKFEETLTLFERDLKKEHWRRLVYLDEYFPAFFHGFFYLYSASYNSFTALPKVTRIDDSLYEIIPNSVLSDKRVANWRANPDHIVKLRIAAKELAYQMKLWRTKVIAGTDYMHQHEKSKKFIEAYELFIRVYFGLPPPVSPPRKSIF